MNINQNTGHQNMHRQITKLGKNKIVPLTESSRHYTVENKVDNEKIRYCDISEYKNGRPNL